MDDITDRLRNTGLQCAAEAAAEIEQLRSQLAARDRDIADWFRRGGDYPKLDKLSHQAREIFLKGFAAYADAIERGDYRKDKGGE